MSVVYCKQRLSSWELLFHNLRKSYFFKKKDPHSCCHTDNKIKQYVPRTNICFTHPQSWKDTGWKEKSEARAGSARLFSGLLLILASLEEALKLLFLLEPPPQQSCQKKYFRGDSLGSVFLEQLRGPGPLTGGHFSPASLPHPRFSRAVWAKEFLNLPCDQRLFRELMWCWGAAHRSHLPQEPPSAG